MKETEDLANLKICSICNKPLVWFVLKKKLQKGQSVDIKHLGKYLRKTRDKAYNHFIKKGYSEEDANNLAEDRMMEDLKSGIQTIQYQINTLMTTNGLFTISNEIEITGRQ